MKHYHFINSLFNEEMSSKQRKVATYLLEQLKYNDQTSLPSNRNISKATKVSINSITQIINELKLKLLKQDECGIWYMSILTRNGTYERVSDDLFETNTFDYILVSEEAFNNLSSEKFETYCRCLKLSYYMKLNKGYHPCWNKLASTWNINTKTLEDRIYSMKDYIRYDLINNQYINNLNIVS